MLNNGAASWRGEKPINGDLLGAARKNRACDIDNQRRRRKINIVIKLEIWYLEMAVIEERR